MRKISGIIVLAALLLPLYKISAQLVINEFLASNTATISDPDFNGYSDWVELYNPSGETKDIGGYFLTDQLGTPKWAFPAGTQVPAGGFLLIWLDGKNTGLHTPFSIKQIGDQIGLYDPSGVLLDSIIYEHHMTDISYGRKPDGNSAWTYFEEPTPGAANNTPGSNGRAPSVVMSLDPGFYQGKQTVELTVNAENAEIYYTKDGSVPTKDSRVYTEPVTIRLNTVLRARAYIPEYLESVVTTATYFIDEREFNLPVLSLSTDPDNLWDDMTGIHVVGTNGIERFNVVANYNQDWERPVSMELFETNGQRAFQFDGGTKIYGQYSRKRPQKSLAIFARKQYGTREIPHRFFKEKPIDDYKTIVLRNSGNDWVETMFSDAFTNYLVKDMMDIDYMAYQPAAIFLNGEYWGILNIREKINEHYVTANYGIPAEQVDMLENAGDNSAWLVNGTYDDWVDLRTYCETHDLADPASYNYVKSKIDLEEFINYQITEIYVHNTDWLTNNMKFWRDHNDPTSKWRWITYDIDRGFGIRGAPPDDTKKDGMSNLGRATYDEKYHRWVWVLVNLLENDDFEQLFLEKFQTHIYTTFHPDRVEEMYEYFISMLEYEIEYHIDLWGDDRDDWGPFDEQTLYGWYDIVDNKISWAEDRPEIMMGYLQEHFNLGDYYKLKISKSDPEGGSIKVNGIESPAEEFSGRFFEDYLVNLEAVAADGFKFVEWEGVSFGKTDPTYNLRLDEDKTLTAVFEKFDLRINEFMAANDDIIADERGEYDDWIEIYNSGTSAIDLGGMHLTDTMGDLTLFRIPDTDPDSTTVQPGEFILFWADGQPSQGVLHLGFRLGSGGEEVAIVDRDGTTVIDVLVFSEQFEEISYGIHPDGEGDWQFLKPTPRAENMLLDDPDVTLYINEFMASNNQTLVDEQGEFDDWIEIFNPNDFPVDIGGLFITDDLLVPAKYRIPDNYPDSTTIGPGEYLLIWADSDDEQGILHTTFRLSAGGEEIGLVKANGIDFIDQVSFGNQDENISFGRYHDGEDNWITYDEPTPGSTNVMTGREEYLAAEFNLFPNPAQGEITVRMASLHKDINISVMDLTGKLYLNEIFNNLQEIHLDLTALEKGIYLVHIKTETEIMISKLILQ